MSPSPAAPRARRLRDPHFLWPRAPHDMPALGTPPPVATPTGRTPAVSPRRALWTLALLSFGAFIFVTSEILPFGLISLIATNLGRSESEIGLLVTAYALVVLAASIPLAHYTRAIPRRTVLTSTFVAYAVGMLIAVTAPGFEGLLAGRVLTAAAQALFWAVVTPTAAGLFPPEVRGKAVARLLIGPSAGGILGLPAATWLGQQHGWRAPFFVLAAIAIVVAVTIAFVLPRHKSADGAAARGTAPNRRRFIVVLAVTGTTVLGGATIFTYITPYLHDVTGIASSAIPLLLIASGVAGLTSMILVSRYLDRFPMGTMAVGLTLVAVGWAGVWAFGTVPAATIVFFCVGGFGGSIQVGAFASRVMQVSPGNTDIGIATYATFYNSGTALGSLLGAGLLDWFGARVLPLVGAGFVALALGLVALERRIVARR